MEWVVDYRSLIQACEEHLRTGRDLQVRRLLHPLNLARVGRDWRLPLANICRRSSLITPGLRLLTPVVHSTRKSEAEPARPPELAEYAILLQRAGAVQEALQILNRLDIRTQPIVLLYKAFCHFNLWQYGSTLDLLKMYSETVEDPYQKFIGKVNLAAAFVALNQWREAESLLWENIETATANGYGRLLGNSHELLSQVYLLTSRVEEAEASIQMAESVFEAPNTLDRLLVEKCRALREGLRSRSRAPLRKLAEQARAWPHPETAREADLFGLLVEYDEETHRRLLFGTPFPDYRTRAQQLLERSLPTEFYVYGSASGATAQKVLDVMSGKVEGSLVLSPGSQTHQLLEILLRDFYRPSRIGTLFGELFTGEYFDIFSSPGRVRQALRRARQWIRESGVGLEVVESRGTYTARVRDGFGVQVPVQRRSVGTYETHLHILREVYLPGVTFTALAARTRLGLSASAMQRFLAWATANGGLLKRGASSNSRYLLPLLESKAA